jgi:hypothetical protein
MIDSGKRPLFTVANHHFPGTGQPPKVDGDEPNTYHGYFENRYGEQSLFIYRAATGEAVLYCGDADWKAYPVINGEPQGLVLAPEEKIWLRACVQAIGEAT